MRYSLGDLFRFLHHTVLLVQPVCCTLLRREVERPHFGHARNSSSCREETLAPHCTGWDLWVVGKHKYWFVISEWVPTKNHNDIYYRRNVHTCRPKVSLTGSKIANGQKWWFLLLICSRLFKSLIVSRYRMLCVPLITCLVIIIFPASALARLFGRSVRSYLCLWY